MDPVVLSMKTLIGESGDWLLYDNILVTVAANALTGQRIGCDVRFCVRVSFLCAFFWSMKHIWTNWLFPIAMGLF